jgi:hypothetical protein
MYRTFASKSPAAASRDNQTVLLGENGVVAVVCLVTAPSFWDVHG